MEAPNLPEAAPGVHLVPEVLRLSSTQGFEAGCYMFAQAPEGHVVCMQVIAVDHAAREVKVVQFPTLAVGRSPRKGWEF